MFILDDKDKISNYCVMNWNSTGLGDPQVNKCEQISSDGHQMSLVGARTAGSHIWCIGTGLGRGWAIGVPMSDVQWGALCSEVQPFIMGNGQIGTSPPRGQTGTTENVIFPQLRWRAVISSSLQQNVRTLVTLWNFTLKNFHISKNDNSRPFF